MYTRDLLRAIYLDDEPDQPVLPSAARRLWVMDLDSFVALGKPAIANVRNRMGSIASKHHDTWFTSRMEHPWYEYTAGLQELEDKAPEMPTLPLDRASRHFLGWPERWPQAMMVYYGLWSECAITREARSSLGGVVAQLPGHQDTQSIFDLRASQIAFTGEFDKLVKAPESFRKAWAIAASDGNHMVPSDALRATEAFRGFTRMT